MDNDEFVLSLLGKSMGNNGIEINVSKKTDEKLKNVEFALEVIIIE